MAALKARGIEPGLGTLLVGADAASQSYVGMKHRECPRDRYDSISRRAAGRRSTQAEVARR